MTTMYVATLDTGGISHSGREYVAVAESADAAVAAIYRAWKADHRGSTRLPFGSARTAEALDQYYGIHVHGPIEVGKGIRTDA